MGHRCVMGKHKKKSHSTVRKNKKKEKRSHKRKEKKEKHVSSSGSESETEHNSRKRIYSDSEATEPKPAKMAKLKGVQKSISGFFIGSESSSASPTAANVLFHGEKEKLSLTSLQPTHFNIDSVIEVYRFGHTKCHYKRHTIVSSSLLNHQLNEFKKSWRELYGVEQDARRANIGSFEVDVGICGRAADGSLATLTAKTEAEWQNVVARLQSQLHQYQLLIQIIEIQYKAVPGVLQSAKKIVKKSRRPEGRSERTIQEEQLLNALRSYITVGQSSSNEFQFERTQEQKERLESFKEDVATRYPGCEAVNELQIRCGKCRKIRIVNRMRYAKHFGDSHWQICKTSSKKSCNIASMFAAIQAAITEDDATMSDVQWESTQEASTSSDSEGSKYCFPCVALEDLDSVVVMLQREIESKKLDRDHIFYRCLKSALEFAQKSSDPSEQFKHDETVNTYMEMLEFHGKPKTMNLLRGPGHRNQGRGGTFKFNWKDWNLPIVPSKTTRDKNKAWYRTRNGIIKSLLVAYLLLSKLEDSGVQPLLHSSSLLLIPTALATDYMSIKPGLQFDRRVKELVGLLFPVSLTYVKENPVPDPSFLRGSFIVKANALILTTLENKLSLPVGNDYACKRNDGNAVKDRVEARVKQLQICLRCLLNVTETCMNVIISTGGVCSSYCQDCTSSSSVCQSFQRSGQKFVEAPLRACSHCINSGAQCVKLLVSVWSADCEESNKQAMLQLVQDKTDGNLPRELQFLFPMPEATHVAKCLKGSLANCFLYKGGERFNLSNLRTLYNDHNPEIRGKMRNAVTLSAVRNRDRK